MINTAKNNAVLYKYMGNKNSVSLLNNKYKDTNINTGIKELLKNSETLKESRARKYSTLIKNNANANTIIETKTDKNRVPSILKKISKSVSLNKKTRKAINNPTGKTISRVNLYSRLICELLLSALNSPAYFKEIIPRPTADNTPKIDKKEIYKEYKPTAFAPKF